MTTAVLSQKAKKKIRRDNYFDQERKNHVQRIQEIRRNIKIKEIIPSFLSYKEYLEELYKLRQLSDEDLFKRSPAPANRRGPCWLRLLCSYLSKIELVRESECGKRVIKVKSTEFYHPGGLSDSAHSEWLKDPYRHIHGGSRERNERRKPASQSPYRAVMLANDLHEHVSNAHVNITGLIARPRESKEWNGRWDNAVRVLEG